ncbi:hypothetical protein WOLCODRAFT_164113 [Wolfiporia cocos MD-104 SS10]|uniref:Uncharacterized protein n=1 Tax=Wolfiporia cocos (strain MD-104) TaxID=742152 RepID=A0A2H3K3F4_WOLCO|nr:hypothetical protein WOLCODRAFT_164113 [Wolfiporia cocos MD-104 SS10]
MANLHDDAWRGNLTADRLKGYLRADPSIIDSPGGRKQLTPLAAACQRGHIDVVRLLLDNPYYLPDVDAPCAHNRTPLYYAIRYCPPRSRTDIVRALLDAGADADARSDFADGDITPLMNAITMQDTEVIGLLLKHGASPSIKNASGKNALMLAEEHGLDGELLERSKTPTKQAQMINAIVALVMLILALFDSPIVRGVVCGVVKKLSVECGISRQVEGASLGSSRRQQAEHPSPSQRISIHCGCRCTCQSSPTRLNSPKSITKSLRRKNPISKQTKSQSVDHTSDDEIYSSDYGVPVEVDELFKVRPSLPTEAHSVSPEVREIAVLSPAASGTRCPQCILGHEMEYQRPAPATSAEFSAAISSYVENRGLEKIFDQDSILVEHIAEKAAELRLNADATPESVDRLIHLALYQIVIFCDDSSSMSSGRPTRWDSLRGIVSRICGLASRILPEDKGVALHFINASSSPRSNLSADDVQRILNSNSPNGGTPIGTALKSKVLQPLVYNIISRGGSSRSLERPLLICIITDGMPEGEPMDQLKNNIIECTQRLAGAGYDRKSVMFCVSQIGDDSLAMMFLNNLRNERSISDVLHCTQHRIDVKPEGVRDNEEGKLDEWLLDLLTKPIMDN